MKRKPTKADIDERINDEMRQLQKVDAILTCVVVASEFADEKIDLGDAVRVALKMVRKSLKKLDGMTLDF